MNVPEPIINMVKNRVNPQTIVKQFAGNNPILNDLIHKAENNDIKSIENFARNLFKQKGLDLDKEFESFKQKLK